jgi:hypothetical protein
VSARKRIRERGGLRLAAFFCLLAAAGLACRRGISRATADSHLAAETDALSRSAPESVSANAPGPSFLTRAEARSIDAFLAKNPDLRLATDADEKASDDSDDVMRLYGVYHPYFVRGDVNDDGSLDFVAAFTNQKNTGADPRFTVAVFCSDRSGRFGEPVILEREISIGRGDVSIDRDCVLITPDLGEDASRRYRWNGLRRHFDFVSDDDGSAEPHPLDRI